MRATEPRRRTTTRGARAAVRGGAGARSWTASCATRRTSRVRRAALRTLAVVVNPKKRAGCPACGARRRPPGPTTTPARRRARGGGGARRRRRRPSSLAAFWDAAAADGDTQSMLLALETLAYACAFAEDGPGILEDALRRLKGAKASFGAVVEGLRSGAMDHHGAREAFKRKLDGVVDDYVAGLGDAAPCKRVPAREIVVAGARNARGAALFWRRGISFEFAFPDAPEEAQRIDVAYATPVRCRTPKRLLLCTASRHVPGAHRSRRPRAPARVRAERARWTSRTRGSSPAFDASRSRRRRLRCPGRRRSTPTRSARRGTRASGGRSAASPLKTSRGVACIVAGPPVRTAGAPAAAAGRRACQTGLTSPRTAETFLGANPPAESPEPPFLTAKMNVSPSPAGASTPQPRVANTAAAVAVAVAAAVRLAKALGDARAADARSPSPRRPIPTPSPPPPPPSAARTGSRGAKAPGQAGAEPEPAAAPELAAARGSRARRRRRPSSRGGETGRPRRNPRFPPGEADEAQGAEGSEQAPDAAPEARAPLAEMDEPNPRAKTPASRPGSSPAAPSAAAARRDGATAGVGALEPPRGAQAPARENGGARSAPKPAKPRRGGHRHGRVRGVPPGKG